MEMGSGMTMVKGLVVTIDSVVVWLLREEPQGQC